MFHAALGIAMRGQPGLARLHALTTLLYGTYVACSEQRIYRLVYVAAYVAGCEVLWRMSGAITIGWEICKYATSVYFLIALWRMRRIQIHPQPVLYLACLFPSVVLTFARFGFVDARKPLLFNLSGPIALAISALFFGNVRMSREQYWKMCMAFATPVVGLAAVTAFGTYGNADISFSDSSNLDTSGGFGPNQVSAILGLASLMMLRYLIEGEMGFGKKLAVLGGFLVFTAQSAMTFSRGGLYGAAGGFLAALFFLIQIPRVRARAIAVAVAAVAISALVILPALNRYTSGALLNRFEDTDTTRRGNLVMEDLQMWVHQPIFGVGVGVSRLSHEGQLAAHTEFSRLLAEHGLFGAVSVVLLLAMSLQKLKSSRNLDEQANTVSSVVWSFLTMSAASTRVVASAYMFGLGQLSFAEPAPPRRVARKDLVSNRSRRGYRALALEGTQARGGVSILPVNRAR